MLGFINEAIEWIINDSGKESFVIADMFSGSGIVSRFFKRYSSNLIVNDLEGYSYTLNQCYLSNVKSVELNKLKKWYKYLTKELSKKLHKGFISNLYAPKDSNNIKIGERCFFTTRNAMYIDTCRQLINEIPDKYRMYFIAPLLTEASIKNNTSGVFKGFYKNSMTGIGQFGGNDENALSRIKKDIVLQFPVFSNFNCNYEIFKEDANALVKDIGLVDILYLDPPYNQHPYGSNYFMLNLINDYIEPKKISTVSGIPVDWNRSIYNKEKESRNAFEQLCLNAKAKYLLISFNSDGYIKNKDMLKIVENIGKVKVFEKKYNTFRGSRNLRSRNIHVKEFLYLVKNHKYC